jgi:hypothetical protein
MDYYTDFIYWDKKTEKQIIYESFKNQDIMNIFIEYIKWKMTSIENNNYPIINLLIGYNCVITGEKDEVINEVMEKDYGIILCNLIKNIKNENIVPVFTLFVNIYYFFNTFKKLGH